MEKSVLLYRKLFMHTDSGFETLGWYYIRCYLMLLQKTLKCIGYIFSCRWEEVLVHISKARKLYNILTIATIMQMSLSLRMKLPNFPRYINNMIIKILQNFFQNSILTINRLIRTFFKKSINLMVFLIIILIIRITIIIIDKEFINAHIQVIKNVFTYIAVMGE